MHSFAQIGLLIHIVCLFGTGIVNFIQYKYYKLFRIQRKIQTHEFTYTDIADLLEYFIGNIFLSVLVYIVVWEYLLQTQPWSDLDPRFWPVIPFKFAFYVLAAEVWFYCAHRLFHWSPWLYKTIHKKHHEHSNVISFCTLYVHPLEHVLINLGAVFIGPVIWRTDIVTLIIWMNIATLNAVMSHSGVVHPWYPQFIQNIIHAHDFHHSHFTCHYGAIGLLDRLFQTEIIYPKPPLSTACISPERLLTKVPETQGDRTPA